MYVVQMGKTRWLEMASPDKQVRASALYTLNIACTGITGPKFIALWHVSITLFGSSGISCDCSVTASVCLC